MCDTGSVILFFSCGFFDLLSLTFGDSKKIYIYIYTYMYSRLLSWLIEVENG